MSPVESVGVAALDVSCHPPLNTGWNRCCPLLVQCCPVQSGLDQSAGSSRLQTPSTHVVFENMSADRFNMFSTADGWSSVGQSDSRFQLVIGLNSSFSPDVAKSTHLAHSQTRRIRKCRQTPGLIQSLDGDSAGYLLVVNDEVGVALVIVEDDIDLGVHPVVHTGVIKVTGGVTKVDGWRSPHGGISYSKPVNIINTRRLVMWSELYIVKLRKQLSLYCIAQPILIQFCKSGVIEEEFTIQK